MNSIPLRWFKFSFNCGVAGLLGMLLVSASGCASKIDSVLSGGNRTEIVTDSDEPEVRRRARIRLELAVGYFEQGQTTIALDELKQSLAADPDYAEAYSLRGLIYMRLNEFRIAEESFKKSIALSPKDSNVVHNLGWLLCIQAKYPDSIELFIKALSNPQYGERAKTYRALGLCQARAGLRTEAEASLLKSHEFDAGNPVTAFNLATLLFQRADYTRAQFYVRRLNNSELANAESLWLGIKVERRLENRDAMLQLAGQLLKRFPQSNEAVAYQRGTFDE
jgi:type IV pilus assembly protein PilF